MENTTQMFLTLLLLLLFPTVCTAQRLTLVEMNCENFFNTRHDSLKQDTEFLPEGSRRWTPMRYWRKVRDIAQALLACDDTPPDLVALTEVENDSVMRDLCRRSPLRNAGYHYLMTESSDVRGIDVALLYQPTAFRPVCYDYISVMPPKKNMRTTRDILYVKGETLSGTLHVFVVHAPSRYGGEKESRPYRLAVAHKLAEAIAAIGEARIVVAGDFNDYANSPAMRFLNDIGLHNLTADKRGSNGAKGTYRYKGEWRSVDHVLASPSMAEKLDTAYIFSPLFLLEDEPKYGGKRPLRTYNGYRYTGGTSDHLPLVVRFHRLCGTISDNH